MANNDEKIRRNPISNQSKLARVINLRMRGLNDNEISKQMNEDGYKHISPRTVSRLLKEAKKTEFADELIQQQLRDITISDTALRLKFRDKLIDKFNPPQSKLEVKGLAPIQIIFDEGLKDGKQPTDEDTNKLQTTP